jgi:dephospho-CoA kinase
VNIAVTGGLGSGKSTASRILAVALGAELIDTDHFCRLQMEPGQEGYVEFNRIFGKKFLNIDGIIDRPKLRQAVFYDRGVKEQLESILHPIVRKQVAAREGILLAEGRDLVVEVPLLFEVGWQDDFDTSVVVYVPDMITVKRVVARDGLSVDEIEKVLDSQMDISIKLEKADFTIDNSGIFISTVAQLMWLATMIKGQKIS